MDMSKMQEMLQQAGAMQQQMDQRMAETVVEAEAGGGVVTCRMNGRKELLRLRIQPTAMGASAADLELLEDLIVAAVNNAGRKADQAMQAGVAGMMGGFDLGDPGLPGLE